MDRRSRRTRNALTTALMALLKERPLKSITVTELAELADVNRATFYVHFQDVYDMFDQVKEEFCNICRELVDAHGEELARNENRPFLEDIFLSLIHIFIGFQGFRPEVDRKPSVLNAKATTKVEAFAIDAERFGSYLKTHGDVCYAMAQYLFEMMSLQTREAVNASVYPVLQRFSALLLTLAREFNSAQAPAIIPFSNEELAEMLGVHVNSITNSVVALRNADCAERQRGALVITDFKKLKSIAENLIVEN